MLDARRLFLLQQLAVHDTIAATAQAVHLTGPAVSQQLAVLEREAGIALFEKHGRRLRLTAAGQLLVAHAEVVLGDLDAAEAELATLRGGTRGAVRIAAFASAARALVPVVWRQLAPVSNGPALRLLECEPAQAIASLQRRESDIALVHSYTLLPRELPAGCDQHPLLADPVLLALPAALAAERGLAPGARASLERFATESWLLPGAETSCHEMTRRACGAAGFVPAPVAESSDFAVLAALVAAGVGVSLVPAMALPDDRTGVSLHPLKPPVTRHVLALTLAGTSRRPDVRAVLDALIEVGAQRRKPHIL
jgi:DNA-binding transcriptional LysR family regulator